MLHIFPIRRLLMLGAIVAVATFGLLEGRGAFTGATIHDVRLFAGYVLGIPGAIVLGLFFVWRFFSPAQRLTFPFMGGEWRGLLRFGPQDQQSLRDARLIIKHTLDDLSLVLETRESVSTSLAVIPKRDLTGALYHIYYIFENRRRPEFTVPGRPVVYRGVAILSLSLGATPRLSGEYFTDQLTRGIVEFELKRKAWL